MVSDKEDKISSYNEGFLQIQRLNVAWIKCNNYSTRGQLDKWRWELDTIWRELSNDAKILGKKEQFEENSYYKEVNKLDKTISAAKRLHRSLYYNALNKKEIFLRSLQDSAGKGSKYRDLEEDMMD